MPGQYGTFTPETTTVNVTEEYRRGDGIELKEENGVILISGLPQGGLFSQTQLEVGMRVISINDNPNQAIQHFNQAKKKGSPIKVEATITMFVTHPSLEENKNREKTEKYAGVIRGMIQHENNLRSNRLNWGIVVQGLLFAGITSGKAGNNLVYLVAVAGLCIAISTYFGISLADAAIRNLMSNHWEKHLKWMYPELCMDKRKPAESGKWYGMTWEYFSPVIGIELEFDKRLRKKDLRPWISPPLAFPVVFALAWIGIIILVATDKLRTGDQ